MVLIFLCLGSFTLALAYENLALHKPAYQLHPIKGSRKSQADAAVDGFKSNTSVWGEHCVISDSGKDTAIWWVDLTRISSLHNIVIYYATGRMQWGPDNLFTQEFLGFSVYVSNTTDKADGTLCFEDTSFTIYNITPVINITCVVEGQYIIYYNERPGKNNARENISENAFNDLCEVEVYGCPDPGYYGYDCDKLCPDPNCAYCHIMTGNCTRCKQGYHGQWCMQVCDPGKCGINCSEECGHCLNQTNYSDSDRTCENGCEAGYQGHLCKEKCDFGFYGSQCQYICSSTCQISYKCNHITGKCEDGCKRGWQGRDCLEKDDTCDWQLLAILVSFSNLLYTIIFSLCLTRYCCRRLSGEKTGLLKNKKRRSAYGTSYLWGKGDKNHSTDKHEYSNGLHEFSGIESA